MRNFQYTFETHKRSFISAFSIRMTVLLMKFWKRKFNLVLSFRGNLFEDVFFTVAKGRKAKFSMDLRNSSLLNPNKCFLE